MQLVQEGLRESLETLEHLYVSRSHTWTLHDCVFFLILTRVNLVLTVRREDKERLENRGCREFLDHRGPRGHKEKV